ncbi:MAG: hypothetical protein HYT88_00545 [Candidatus Omnitrophica bacterium]|nr:hypothetical protein [Candidatus Omnitrophota bacterium]
MRLSRWLMVLGVFVTLGCLRVAQQNAVYLKGYEVGKRLENLHQKQVQLSRLEAEVIGLSSPGYLLDVARKRRLDLVAWSRWPSVPQSTQKKGFAARGVGGKDAAGLRLAAMDSALAKEQARAGD